jgi:cell fate regulator YaaT (PSP1 superfamily)
MGCGNCGTGANGKAAGCKSNGGCSTGGCNRMNVFDWLSALPLHDSAKPYPVIEVTFNKGSRKDFYRNNTNHILEKGDWIALEGVSGFDIGQVSLTGELVKLQMKKYGVEDQPSMKRVLRPATDEDINIFNSNKAKESEMLVRSRAMAKHYNLDMKLCEVEIQADGKKATFFYTADNRVDFRELIKAYASEFKVKVEMRQIGARQESGKVGGIGSCGRELCCSTWLTDFKSVNTTAARYQNLSINQTKLSGQCGRLKCCLNYELDTYMDALRVFPDNADVLETVKGKAYLQKRDIFKNLMWYTYSDSNKQYPLTIVRVKEILTLNKRGEKAEELQPVELEVSSNKAGLKVDMGFVNDVGQISLKALEKGSRKKKSNKQGGGQKQGQQARPQGQKPQANNQAKQDGQQSGNQQGQKGGSQGKQGQQRNQQGRQGGENRPQRPQGNRERPQQTERPQGGERQQDGQKPNNPNRNNRNRNNRPKQERPKQDTPNQEG